MRYETPDQVMRKSMRSLNRRMRPMAFGFFTGVTGVSVVFAGQWLSSGIVEAAGAMIALAGMAATFLGMIWFVVTIGRKEPDGSRNRSPAA